MIPPHRALRWGPWRVIGILSVAQVITGNSLVAQQAPPPPRTSDTVTVVAGPRYDRSALYHALFGGAYRDLWITPIRVPVLNLRTFDGGLVPEELGGGNATLSLHLDAADGSEYVFRTVDKNPKVLPEFARGWGLAEDVARDRTAGTHPAANLMHAPFYAAVGVIHDDDAKLYVMPDDPVLGEYREQMAGRLGVLTRHSGKNPQHAAEYANAVEIVDSDTLVQLLNRDPDNHVDPTKYLAARMVDMLLNNWDRHPGNWKWARLTPGGAWQPISRDMDNVFVSQEGFLPGLVRFTTPKLLVFDSGFPALRTLVYKGGILDRRFLMGTPRAVFDSVAQMVQARITDAVIADGMSRMPEEYLGSATAIAAKLKVRRDSLPAVVRSWYDWINEIADIHATDRGERAIVTRVDPTTVQVRLEDDRGRVFFDRRFLAQETAEIRLYLHGGDDRAVVRGDVSGSIPLRIIGGGGSNLLVDSSRVAGQAQVARLYDAGDTDPLDYGVDTVWNRRPLVVSPEGHSIPGRDYGGGGGPIVDVSTGRDQGFMPSIGWVWERYGFRKYPYASRVELEGRYSFRNDGVALELNADRRLESSRLHYSVRAQFSQLELLNYHGLGNSTPGSPGVAVGDRAPRDGPFAIHQEQWLLHPTVGYGLGRKSDVRVGPVVQYAVNEGTPGGFLESTLPYGSGAFGQAGLRAILRFDTRDRSSHPRQGVLFDLRGDYFPAVWDVESTFGALRATAGGYLTLPLPLKPYVGLRIIGQQVFGAFPFHEAAFIGSRGGVRSLDPHRYAGDAALTAKLDIRVPLFTLDLLLPFEIGALAAQEVGRVYVDGESPGGWHDTFGAGFWVDVRGISVTIRLIESNEVFRDATPALRIGTSVGIP